MKIWDERNINMNFNFVENGAKNYNYERNLGKDLLRYGRNPQSNFLKLETQRGPEDPLGGLFGTITFIIIYNHKKFASRSFE